MGLRGSVEMLVRSVYGNTLLAIKRILRTQNGLPNSPLLNVNGSTYIHGT
jgi:hypothetical protein